MAGKTQIETQLKIEGTVSPSVQKALASAHSQLEKFKVQTSEVTTKLNGMWGAAALGGAIGGTVAAAWGKVTSVIEGTIDKVREFGSESLRVAREADRRLGAFGRVLNNQRAAAMLEERFSKLGASTFGGPKLMEIASKLSRFGVKQRYLQGTTLELAKVAQGAGTGEEGLNQLTETYGRVRGRGYMTLRDMQAAERAGVSREDILKLAGGSEDKLAQLIKDKGFTSAMFSKVLLGETQGSGRYADALKKAEDTFNGQSNLINNRMHELEVLWGRIEEKLLKPMLQWFNNSGIWQAGEEWMARANKWSDEILQYFATSGIGQKFTAALEPIKKAWADFNGWLDGFFQTYDPVSGKVMKGLNAEGKDKLNQMFTSISDMIRSAADFVASDSFRVCTTMAWDTMTFGIRELFTNLREIFDLVADIKTGNWGKLWEDIKRYELGGDTMPKKSETPRPAQVDKLAGVAELRNKENARFEAARQALEATYRGGEYRTQEYQQKLKALTDAHEKELQRIEEATKATSGQTDATKNATEAISAATAQTKAFSDAMAQTTAMLQAQAALGYGMGGYGSNGSFGKWASGTGVALEQYPWEGHAANFGPKNNRLGDGYGIGLGVEKQKQVGAHFGDWVRVQFANGQTLTRQVNETSERPMGVEFFSNRRGKYESLGKIMGVQKVGGPQASAQPVVNIHNHVYAMDSTGVDHVMQAHGDRILDHLNKLHGKRTSQRGLV
jgi:hypothetical protein